MLLSNFQLLTPTADRPSAFIHSALASEPKSRRTFSEKTYIYNPSASFGDVEEAKAILVREMESAVSLRVPLDVEAGVGATWFDAK